MKSSIKPPRLKHGGNIRIVAPASAPNMVNLSKGVSLLKHLGYGITFGRNIKRLVQKAYLSAPDEERAAELMEAFTDDTVGAIFSACGGYGAMRILPYLDYDKIRDHPKVLVGYSDITALHLAINSLSGLVTFHGHMPSADAEEMRKPYYKDALEVLSGNSRELVSSSGRVVKYVVPGSAEGLSMGTNFSLVASLIGTKYMRDVEGKLLFLEDVGTTAWDIDRYFFRLKLAELLSKFGGFVFGDFTDVPKIDNPMPPIEEIVEHYMEIAKKPSIYGMPFGHGEDQMLIPLNAKIKISTDEPYIKLLEAVVE